MKKVIKIGDKELTVKATGATPRLYRLEFKRDLFVDMQKLESLDDDNPERFEILENVAYMMAKQGETSEGHDFPKDITEWLESFDMLEFFEVLPDIFELWADNNATTTEPKKK